MTANPFVILYVEDDDFVRDSVADMLGKPERRFVCVPDGASARQALREHNVNLLLTDINLPDGSGLEVAREALLQNPGMPLILCSGEDVRDVVGSLGSTAHSLRKPFHLDELEALVDRLGG